MADYLPSKDNLLLAWLLHFDALLTANPLLYGATAAIALEVHNLVQDFSTRLGAAQNPVTRNAGTIAAKQASKAAVKAKVRQVARIINAFPGTTNQYRADLGLHQRDTEPTVIPAPATRPIISFDTSGPKKSSIRVVDELTPTSRKRLEGAIGCEIWGKIAAPGEAPPIGISECRYMGIATRNRMVLEFQDADGGKRCHLIGRWVNHRGQTGPESNVVSATIAA